MAISSNTMSACAMDATQHNPEKKVKHQKNGAANSAEKNPKRGNNEYQTIMG